MMGQTRGGLADRNTDGFRCRGVAHPRRLHPDLGRVPPAQERSVVDLVPEVIEGPRMTSERKATWTKPRLW